MHIINFIMWPQETAQPMPDPDIISNVLAHLSSVLGIELENEDRVLGEV